jgi:hypothetical protein
MKMGNIASLWRYDASAHCALRSSRLQPAMPYFASVAEELLLPFTSITRLLDRGRRGRVVPRAH